MWLVGNGYNAVFGDYEAKEPAIIHAHVRFLSMFIQTRDLSLVKKSHDTAGSNPSLYEYCVR